MSEISGFQTFISDGFISSRKCPIQMVDPALNSLDSEFFNALFDVITAFFPAALSRKKLGDPLRWLLINFGASFLRIGRYSKL